MLQALRARNPDRSIPAICFYEVAWLIAWTALTVFFRMRCLDKRRVPRNGPLLVVLNHQSHLDAPIAGMCLGERHLNFIARSGLFKNPLFGGLIGLLNSVPINQEGSDTGAIRTAIDQLKKGRCVLIFPEGTRTPDGAMRGFKRGVWVLLSRAKCPVLPIAVEGCFDTWPRGTGLPRLWGRRIAGKVGQPIAAETLLAMGPDRGLRHLAKVIDDMRLELRRELRLATRGEFPAHGPGDGPIDPACAPPAD